MSSMLRLALLGLVLAMGCKKAEPTPAELVAGARAQLEPKVAMLEKIGKTPLPTATGAIKLAGPPLRIISFTDPTQGNATVVFDADLKDDLSWIASVDVRGPSATGVANNCVMLVRKGVMAGIHDKRFDRDPMADESEPTKRVLTSCGLLRYLVVVKLLDYKATKYIDSKTFGGGSGRAEALVFDLETGAFAGGVTFEASSSARTKSDIDSDLMANFARAMDGALEKALPDAQL